MGRTEWLDWVERRRPVILRWMVRRCGSFAEAQDLAEEVIEAAVRLGAGPAESDWEAWLLRAREVVLRRARRRWRRQCYGTEGVLSLDHRVPGAISAEITLGDTVAAPGPAVDEACLATALWEALRDRVAGWPEADRDVLLQAAEGQPTQEAAARLGLSRHAYRRRLLFLRRRLLAELDDDTAAEVRALLGQVIGI